MHRHLVLALGLCVALTGCGSAGSARAGEATDRAGSGTELRIATAFYPLSFLAQRLAGEGAVLDELTAAGAEPHDLELTPRQVAGLQEADLVLHLAGFQPSVDRAVQQQATGAAFDVSTVTPLEPGYVPLEEGVPEPAEQGLDPHVWLAPLRYAAIADAVADRMAEIRPAQAARFRARAAQLRGKLTELDEQYRTGLSTCDRRQLVTSHNAFGYLASAYDLEQVPIAGFTPDAEPSPHRLAEVAEYAEANEVTTVYFEELVDPSVAAALAREVGAEPAALSPLEVAPQSGDYFTGMRANLTALRQGLGCSGD
jgi:zinc transport system substrate-binding protein